MRGNRLATRQHATIVSLGAAADIMTRTRAHTHTQARARARLRLRYVIQLEQLTNNGRTAHHYSFIFPARIIFLDGDKPSRLGLLFVQVISYFLKLRKF